MKKYYAYIRKSTDEKDRQTLSLESQKSIIKEFSKRKGLAILEWVEESKSAKEPGREKFNKMISNIYAGKADGIVAHKVDRLSRNDADQAALIYLIKKGKSLRLVEGEYDFNTPSGLFSLRINGNMATNYSENLGQEVKKGIATKLDNGWFPGYAPTGYLNTRAGDGKNVISLDEKKALLIKKAYELIAFKNRTLSEVADYISNVGLTSRDGGEISKGVLWKIITNPFYYGLFRWDNKLIKGEHDAIVSQEVWQRANDIVSGKTAHRSKTHYYPYRGFIFCGECGRKITAENQKNHTYYRCSKSKGVGSCYQPYLRREELEGQFEDLFKKIKLDRERSEMVKTDLIEAHEQEIQFRDTAIRSINAKIATLRSKKDRLLDLRLDNEITKEDHDIKKASLENEIQDLEIELLAHKKADDNWNQEVEGFFELINSGYEIYKLANDHEKELMVKTISSNLIIKDRKLVPELKLAFSLVSNEAYRTDWLGRRDSNPRIPGPKPGALPLGHSPSSNCDLTILN